MGVPIPMCAGHGTHLKGESIASNNRSQDKSQAQPDGGEGHSVITTGYPVTVLRKAVAPLRWSSTKVRGDVQKSSQACIVGRACNTRQSPLSIIGNVRILGIHVLKDVCLTPGGLSCAPERRVRLKLAEGRATCSDRMGEVSRGHSSRRKRDAREPAGQA